MTVLVLPLEAALLTRWRPVTHELIQLLPAISSCSPVRFTFISTYFTLTFFTFDSKADL